MKKLYKLTNQKLNQLFWVIIVAFVLQIFSGVVLSLCMSVFSSPVQNAVGIESKQMFLESIIVVQMTNAMWTVLAIGNLIPLFAMFRCDMKHYIFLGVNQKENTISNICVGLIISIVVAFIYIISQAINLLVVRGIDGCWLSAIADSNAIDKLLYNALLCILATFTIHMLLVSLKQVSVLSLPICILLLVAIMLLIIFSPRIIGDWKFLREVILTRVGGVVTLIVSGAIFATSYCCLTKIVEVKRKK